MCRRSVLCGAVTVAVGVGMIFAVLIGTESLSVLLGIGLILGGTCLGRMR